MNKRFFTLMAAVLLAGAPLCNEALASSPVLVPIDGGNYTAGIPLTSVAPKNLANGLKFVIAYDEGLAFGGPENGTYKYITVSDVDNTNYVTRNGDDTSDLAKAAVFEVRNYSSKSFELWVDGKQFVTDPRAETAYSPANSSEIVKRFVAKDVTTNPVTVKSKTDFNALYTLQTGAEGNKVWRAKLIPGTINETFTATDFNDFNSNSTTLSFDAPNLVGNIFEGLTPVTFTGITNWGGKFPAGTYFVSGSADDVKAFIKSGATDLNIQRAAAKLQFAYISGTSYELDAIDAANGEGRQLIMVAGSEFYKTTGAADVRSAKFTANTVDNLNNEGLLKLAGTAIVNNAAKDVVIAAVKTSGSDASSYVTTLKAGSALTAIHPTLGSNTYIAASEFLSSGKSVYNIYFTSGVQSTKEIKTEYHKYLAVGSDGSKFVVNALAADDVQLDSPLAQWVATGFDGKYTLKLTNRQTQKNLVLKLQPTATAGVYDIVSLPNSDFDKIANIQDLSSTSYDDQELKNGKTIKLVKTTTTKTDGFLDLTKEEMAAGIALAFSGKTAELGATTFYAVPNHTGVITDTYNKLYPSQSASKVKLLNIKKDVDGNGDADYIINETNYAYLDAKGAVATDKVDTLAMPTYNLSYTFKKADGTSKTAVVTDKWFNMSDASGAVAQKLFFQKAMDGSYVMTDFDNTTFTHINEINYNWQSVSVHVSNVGATSFVGNVANIYAPKDADFAKITVIVNTNEDRTSLEAVSRHATLENARGGIAFEENKNGILEGILAAEGMTFWLDTADSETTAPAFYISKGIAAAEEEAPATKADEAPAARNFLFYAADSLYIFNEGSAMATTNEAYRLENTDDLKAIFRPAALIGEDTLATVVDGKEVTLKNSAVKPFQFGIVLADEDVEGEYVIYSKANSSQYLYSHNGKLGFGSKDKAMVFTIGEGDATANEAIAAESGVQVIGGQGVVTVQGAAGKVITVANILGQTIANQVAASDNVTIAAPAGIVVVAVDGEATKVVVK